MTNHLGRKAKRKLRLIKTSIPKNAFHCYKKHSLYEKIKVKSRVEDIREKMHTVISREILVPKFPNFEALRKYINSK